MTGSPVPAEVKASVKAGLGVYGGVGSGQDLLRVRSAAHLGANTGLGQESAAGRWRGAQDCGRGCRAMTSSAGGPGPRLPSDDVIEGEPTVETAAAQDRGVNVPCARGTTTDGAGSTGSGHTAGGRSCGGSARRPRGFRRSRWAGRDRGDQCCLRPRVQGGVDESWEGRRSELGCLGLQQPRPDHRPPQEGPSEGRCRRLGGQQGRSCPPMQGGALRPPRAPCAALQLEGTCRPPGRGRGSPELACTPAAGLFPRGPAGFPSHVPPQLWGLQPEANDIVDLLSCGHRARSFPNND